MVICYGFFAFHITFSWHNFRDPFLRFIMVFFCTSCIFRLVFLLIFCPFGSGYWSLRCDLLVQCFDCLFFPLLLTGLITCFNYLFHTLSLLDCFFGFYFFILLFFCFFHFLLLFFFSYFLKIWFFSLTRN